MLDSYAHAGITFQADIDALEGNEPRAKLVGIEAVDGVALFRYLDEGEPLRAEDLERAALEQWKADADALEGHYVDVAVKERGEDGR